MIDLKCCTHSSDRLLHKSVPTIFLIMSYSVFAAILWQILKSHFERKRSKTDYPKNIWKKEKCVHGFFRSWLYAFQWEKTIENHICVGAGARKVESLVRFLSNFDPLFSQYSESTEKVQNIYWKYWNILQKYWKCWKHGSNNGWKQRITLSFCLKVLWDLIIHFRSTIQLNDKSFDLNEYREKGKTNKVAESKLVLGAEFLFTAFTFDLVLTARVFCVALHQSFGNELFHLEIHSLYICGTLHKK